MEILKQKREVPVLVYIISGLSLIPWIGGFIGLAILISGLIYYKNKILIAVGSLGILFTISIYGSLYYFGQIERGGVYDEMTVELSKHSLKTLISEIELYNIKNDKYPDNLIQVTKNGYNQLHLDPILNKVAVKGESKEFYYKLESDGYILFSIGFDKIPFTKDDIHPQLMPNEIEKYGYKRLNPAHNTRSYNIGG